jgi:MFS family permease
VSVYYHLLRKNPDFTRLWIAQVISLTGDWFNTIVLLALVGEHSGGSGLAISVYLLARLLPPLIVSPYTGVLVDRFDRKTLLVVSDVARALIVLLYLVVLAGGPGTLWLIYVLTVFQFGFSGLFEPARNAILPSLLHEDDLVSANTLSSVTWSVMLAVGAIVGGIVAAVLGTNAALIIDSLTFLMSAAFIVQIRVKPQPSDESSGTTPPEHGFREGLRFVRRHPGIAAVLLVKLGQSIGNVDALITIYATELFFITRSDGTIDTTTPLSLMFAAFGVGAVLGPLLLNLFNKGTVRVMRRLIVIGFIWITLGWFVFGWAATLPLVSLALILRAMGGSANWTYSSVIIQKGTPNDYLGRVFSLDMAGFQFASAVSILVTGLLVDWIGTENVRQVAIEMGIASLIPLVVWALLVVALERRQVTSSATWEIQSPDSP